MYKRQCLDGPGHFLGSEQTLSLMQTEYIYPSLGDRTSPKEWVELGKPNLVQKAIEKKENILNNAAKKIDPIIDKKLRSEFNIHLA